VKYSILILYTLVLTACGGGGGSVSSANTPTVSHVLNQTLAQVTTYQNSEATGEIFNTQVADLNGDGLEDVVVSGWAVEPAAYANAVHGKVPVKILIQQTDGTLKDQTDAMLGVGNNMIYGSQRIIIADFDSDGKPDIFLGGFQDSPSLSNQLCCSPVASVMFWNDGAVFTRYDFVDTVWAHAVCIGDLNGDGPSIVMGGTNTYANNIYINNGLRNFTLTHTAQFISSGGACAVVKDANSGNIGIVTTNVGFALVAGYNAVVQIFDRNMNFLNVIGLPGAEGTAHDIVNIVSSNNLLILTDNKLDNGTGSFTALQINAGLSFTNVTSTYFPSQPNNYYFQYYTRSLNINGSPAIYVDNVDSNWNFSTLPDLWILTNGSFQPSMQPQMSTDIGNYSQPTLYKDSDGNLRLLLIQNNNNTFTFYTKPV